MKRSVRRAIAVVLVAGIAVTAGLALLYQAPSLEQEAIVARFTIRHQPKPQGIVVVGIDTQTLSSLGPWPFKRSLHAQADRSSPRSRRQARSSTTSSSPSRRNVRRT